MNRWEVSLISNNTEYQTNTVQYQKERKKEKSSHTIILSLEYVRSQLLFGISWSYGLLFEELKGNIIFVLFIL